MRIEPVCNWRCSTAPESRTWPSQTRARNLPANRHVTDRAGLSRPAIAANPRHLRRFCQGRRRSLDSRLGGWGGRIRTSAWRYQKPLPYRLATPQCAAPSRTRRRGAQPSSRPPRARAARIPPQPAKSLLRRSRVLAISRPPADRSVAQPGRAPRSGRGGRRFKSCHSDQNFPICFKTSEKRPSRAFFFFRADTGRETVTQPSDGMAIASPPKRRRPCCATARPMRKPRLP